jgi:hypothetical protein
MSYAQITAMILSIATIMEVPPYFCLSIALTENPELNPMAVSKVNENGTVDLGIFQVNSEYFGHIDWCDTETNVRAGVEHIKYLIDRPETTTYWSVCIAYNAGISRVNNPPVSTLNYADRVMAKWHELQGGYIPAVIGR